MTLAAVPDAVAGVATCDNEFTLYVNGQKIAESPNWEQPVALALDGKLKKGANEFVVVAKNGGSAPNPAVSTCFDSVKANCFSIRIGITSPCGPPGPGGKTA